MAKRSNKRRRSAKVGNAPPQESGAYMDEEMDDEIDAFHKQRDIIPLDVNKDSCDSDDDMEEPVFDLQNEDADEEEEKDDEDDVDFDDVEDKGFAAKLVRQAKYLKEKFGGGEDEISGEDELDEERKTLWGSKKNMYYSADNIDYELQSSDEDLLMEEEAEVIKIQRERAKMLQNEDFGLEDFENDNDYEEKTFQELGNFGATQKSSAVSFKDLKKDVNALSKPEQMDAVYSYSPELGSPLLELNTAVDKLREVKSLPDKMMQMSSKFLSQDGNAGSHTFESINDSNMSGESISLEPIQSNLVEIPDVTKASKNLGLLKGISKDADSKYDDKKLQDSRRDLKSIEMLELRKNLEAKLKQNGIYSQIQGKVNKISKDLMKPTSRNLVTTNDYEDEVKQVEQHGQDYNRRSLSKLAQALLAKSNGFKAISGDDDLPKRDDFVERRRKHELRVLARAGVVSMDEDEDEACDNPDIKSVGTAENKDISEDEFYRNAKKQRAEKLVARAELYSRPQDKPVEEPEADGKRQITRQIEKNRGLTRNRKKLTKNPRKKYKLKHQKAVIRRKGQVREIRKPSGPYGGEATGINTNVSRSIRFKS